MFIVNVQIWFVPIHMARYEKKHAFTQLTTVNTRKHFSKIFLKFVEKVSLGLYMQSNICHRINYISTLYKCTCSEEINSVIVGTKAIEYPLIH